MTAPRAPKHDGNAAADAGVRERWESVIERVRRRDMLRAMQRASRPAASLTPMCRWCERELELAGDQCASCGGPAD